MSGEGPYLCIPNRNKPLVDNRKRATQKVERSLKVWKQQHVNEAFTVRFMLAKNIDERLSDFERDYDSQCQNSFTMESLILAQDER